MQSGSAYGDSDDTRVAKLASRQDGVVATRQLRALGYSKHAIHHRVKAGRLHPIHRGVYAVGHTKLTARGRWTAAVLACGPDAVLSHHDAATLHDLRPVGGGLIHVTATSRHILKDIRCHRVRALQPDDVVVIDGIPVTTLERTLLDLAEILHPQRLRDVLEKAQRQDKLDFLAIEARISHNSGRHGAKALRAALAESADERPWTQSELEERFLELVCANGLPQPLMNQYVEGKLVDAVWREHHLVVEIDGWRFHKTRSSFEDDRRTDAELVQAGWRAVRFTYNRLRYEPGEVARTLRKLLSDGPSPPRVRSGQ